MKNSSSFFRAFPVLLGVAIVFATPTRAKTTARISVSAAAHKKQLKLLKSINVDIDGDGQREVVGACEGKEGIALCLFEDDAKGAVLIKQMGWAGGTRLKALKAQALVPPTASTEVVLEVYAENPDEKIKRIRIYGGESVGGPAAVKEIFSNAIFRAKDKAERPSWETDPSVVRYGDARPGWYFEDLDDDGTSEIMVRRAPQLVPIAHVTKPVKVLSGVHESVYRYAPLSHHYVEDKKKRYVDFIPAQPIVSVSASSAYIPPKLKKQLQAEAMTRAAVAAAEGADEIPSKDVDLTPFRATAADRDLDTAWIEDVPKNAGAGEWVEVHFAAPVEIHMVRVVTGCVSTKQAFRSHNVPVRFQLRFADGSRSWVDRETPDLPQSPAIGILDLKVKNRPWAKQTLTFFPGNHASSSVRVILDSVRRQGRGNHTCISEVSVH